MIVDDQQPDRCAHAQGGRPGLVMPGPARAPAAPRHRPGRRGTGRDGRPAARLRFHLQRPGQAARSAAASRPGRTRRSPRVPAAGPRAARGRLAGRFRRKLVGPDRSPAVVAHVQRDHVLHVGQRHARPGWPPACLPTLASASWRGRAAARTRPPACSGRAVPVVVTSDRARRAAPTSAGHAGQRVGQPGAAPAVRAQRLHRAAGLGQALPGQPGRGVQVPPPPRRIARGLLGRLELGDDAGQPLGEGVVDLPGHPLPLVEDAGLAGLGEQLRVQARVLGQRRLQPLVGLAQLGEGLFPLLGVGVVTPVHPGQGAQGITLTERTAAYTRMPNGLARSTPDVWAVRGTTATAATPGSRHGHGRTANAYRYPAGVRNPNQGA